MTPAGAWRDAESEQFPATMPFDPMGYDEAVRLALAERERDVARQ